MKNAKKVLIVIFSIIFLFFISLANVSSPVEELGIDPLDNNEFLKSPSVFYEFEEEALTASNVKKIDVADIGSLKLGIADTKLSSLALSVDNVKFGNYYIKKFLFKIVSDVDVSLTIEGGYGKVNGEKKTKDVEIKAGEPQFIGFEFEDGIYVNKLQPVTNALLLINFRTNIPENTAEYQEWANTKYTFSDLTLYGVDV